MSCKLEVDQMSKQFAGGRGRPPALILDGLTFSVEEGEFVAVVGPSGCGKTTLINILAGLEMPTDGRIRLDGRAVKGPGAERGVCFQDYALFPWKTVYENTEFGLRFGPLSRRLSPDERKRRTEYFIELVGLQDSKTKYPYQLSGGMKQRCALARLFANDPELLLMDEPLAAGDAQTRDILQEELLRIWGQDRQPSARKTVVYVTHSIEEAVFLADRVLVLGRRPAKIRDIITIPVPRPRTLTQRHAGLFHEYQERIWGWIRDEAFRATLEG
jgi:NitT/TauT family transport system ATP-binding protein